MKKIWIIIALFALITLASANNIVHGGNIVWGSNIVGLSGETTTTTTTTTTTITTTTTTTTTSTTTTTTMTTTTTTTTILYIAQNAKTPWFKDFVLGEPFQAIRNVFVDLMGPIFYGILFGIFFIAVWIRTESIIWPTILLDIVLAAGFSVYLTQETSIFVWVVNSISIAVLLMRVISPIYQEG